MSIGLDLSSLSRETLEVVIHLIGAASVFGWSIVGLAFRWMQKQFLDCVKANAEREAKSADTVAATNELIKSMTAYMQSTRPGGG